ncbi:MAG: response regulator, partial [Bacteroidetes bacterium]|nr:response regulator [Bacteroidota bacterium]
LDMQMPNMDGAMLASEIRKYRKCEDLPLIMLTSIDKRKEDVKHIEDYFSAYLVKPIKQSLLYTKIISVFSTERKNDKPERGKMLFDPKMVDKHPLRILIADDNVINQKVAERMLQKMGYRPDIVSNGLEILQALEQAPYDLIFIDVHMPEMDGLEATRRICDKYNKDNRPLLVAMTADAMPGDKEKCIEAGMDDYICKPVKIPELEKALKKAFILKLAAEQKLDF